MNMKRVIMTVMLLVGMTLPTLGDTCDVNGVKWSFKVVNGEATICTETGVFAEAAIPTKTKGDLVIPAELGGYPVVAIGDSAFWGCSNLTSVTIPDSVTNIGYAAFSQCSSISHFVIPDSIKKIAGRTFEYCSGVETVTFPAVVESIDLYQMFYGCTSLVSVRLPEKITAISVDTFHGCTSLKDFTIPEGVNYIGMRAFQACSSLGRVEIPSSVTVIERDTFDCCYGLTNVVFMGSISEIQDWAFSRCQSLTNISLPDGISRIGSRAFWGCVGLTSVSIPDSVTSMESDAFLGCGEGLYDSTVSDDILSVDGWACRIADDSYPKSIVLTNCRGVANGAFRGEECIESIEIGDGVKYIGDCAFSDCRNLKSVSIPDSVRGIGVMAFRGCAPELFDVVSVPGVKFVDGWAVEADKSLVGVLDLEICRGIADGGVFALCTGLTKVILSDNAKGIGAAAFSGCTALSDINLPSGIPCIGTNTFYNCSSLKKVELPESVTSIGRSAFRGCSMLEDVNIGDFVTSIGAYAFYGCRSLSEVRLPEGLTTIQRETFANCSLKKLYWPSSVDTVEAYAFGSSGQVGAQEVHIVDLAAWCRISFDGLYSNPLRGVSGWNSGLYKEGVLLQDLDIPAGVEEIGDYAFVGWHGRSIRIPEGVKRIGNSAFWSNRTTSGPVMLPTTLESVGEFAFGDCDALNGINIPPNVRYIAPYAFDTCGSWRGRLCGFDPIVVPESVSSLGTNAFHHFYVDGYSYCEARSLVAPQWLCETQIAKQISTRIGTIVVHPKVKTVSDNFLDECNDLSELWIPNNLEEKIDLNRLLVNASGNLTNECKVIAYQAEADAGGREWWFVGNGDGCCRIVGVSPEAITNLMIHGFVVPESLGGLRVVEIDDRFFQIMPNVSRFSLTAYVTNVNPIVFFKLPDIAEIAVSGDNPTYGAVDGLLLSKDSTQLVYCPSGREEPLEIPNSVERICSYAFTCGRGISNLTIPESVTTIEGGAFYCNFGLTNVVRKTDWGVGYYSVDGSSTDSSSRTEAGLLLVEAVIKEGVKEPPSSIFMYEYRNSLKKLTLPSTVTRLNDGWDLRQLAAIERVILNGDVFTGYNYLLGKSSIKVIYYPEEYEDSWLNVLSSSNAALLPTKLLYAGISTESVNGREWSYYEANGCAVVSAIEDGQAVSPVQDGDEIVVPDILGGMLVTEIGFNAFADFSSVASIKIPETVTKIGAKAFLNCSSLSEIILPQRVTTIRNGAFQGCIAITSVVVPQCVLDSGLSSVFPSSYQSITNVVIADGATRIGRSSFSDCSSLERVHIPASLTNIDNLAFAKCTRLRDITIAEGNASFVVEGGILYGNDRKTIICCFDKNVESVEIPATVTNVAQGAFAGCGNLRTITLRGDVFSNYGNLFGWTRVERVYYSLKYVRNWSSVFTSYGIEEIMPLELMGSDIKEEIVNSRKWKYYVVDGRTTLCSGQWAAAVEPVMDGDELIVPNTLGGCPVTEIGFCAFVGLSNLGGVVLPPTVTNIAAYAFYECNSLASISIPAAVTAIDDYAFTYCGALSSVKFGTPSVLKRIGVSAFQQCYSMEEFTLPAPDVEVGQNALNFTMPKTLSGILTGTTTLRPGAVYQVTGNITVPQDAALILKPGTILKFNTGCSLTVNGTLDAQGTRAAPIVFTSLKDDAHGGDANGDGDKTYAQAGDWHQIRVAGTANFNYCHVLYNSSTENYGAVEAYGGTVNFDNSEIAHTRYECVNAHSSGNFTARNSVFRDSSLGFGYYGSGRVKAYNCVFSDLTSGIRQSGKTLTNCAFYRCLAFTDQSGDGSTFKNCVFYNPAGYGAQSYSKCGSNGNIWGDPMFVDPENGDFRIAANSPCVDAGDGSFAPETDYWGQPRMDVKKVKDTGTPNVDGVCPDIGIYEVFGRSAGVAVDLAVLSVSAPATASVGDEILVTYIVTNMSETAAREDDVRDMIRLKSADASLGGREIEVFEKMHRYSLPAYGVGVLSARFKVPAVSPGNWRIGVGVNYCRDVFEKNMANNTRYATTSIEVDVEALHVGSSSVSVAKGSKVGYLLSGLPLEGGVARVTGAGAGQVVAYGGNGAMPTSDGGSPGTARPTSITLPDGSLLIVFPARAEGENAYLVLENGGNTSVTVSVEVKRTELKIYGAVPGRVANVGEATITITGSGMFGRGGGALGDRALPVVTLGGREAKSVEVLNAAQIAATFDVEGMSAGVVALVATVAGGSPSSATVPDAIEIYAAKTGPKLRAWLEMPSSVRDGRVFTGYVCYANEGDSPMTMPVFKIVREDSQTKMGLVASESMTETKLYVGGISPTHPAGVLKAGDAARIPFYFQPFGTYKIKLSHVKDAEDLEAYPTFGGTKAYLAAMSAAATRLNLRGRTSYNVHHFVDQALWEKNGVAHAAVSGYLVDAKTGEPLANTSISLVDAGGSRPVATQDPADAQERVPPATGTTDESGYFQLTNLADGEYRWLLDDGNSLADASTNTVTIAGQADINGISVYATPGGRISGYVFAASGEPISDAGITIALTNGMEKAKARTDASGAFRVSGLENGVYCIVAHSFEGFVGDGVSGIVISETERSCERTLTLVPGGVIKGSVTSGGSLVSQGQVQAILPDGTTIETTCSTNGTYVFNGLKPESYVIRYYSSTEESSDAKVTINQGEVCILDLTALPRPLFFPRYSVGYGSLTTEFIFGDYVRMTNITAWAWDFDDDGIVDSTDAQPTHTFDAIRPYTVSVSFTEDGTNVTSRFENCVEVREPLETIYADNVVVVGGKNGEELSVIEVGDGHIAISGSPALPFAEGVVVFYGDVENGFARKIRSASGNASRWDIETDEAELTDVFRQLATCTAMTLGADGTVQNAHGRRLLASKADRTTDWKVFVEGGVTITPIIRNTRRDIEFVCEIRDGEFKRLHAGVIDSADIGLSYSINGEVGVEFQEELPWCEEFNLKGIKHVGYGFLLYPDVHIGINVRISGRADSIEMTHVRNCRLRLGFDMVDGNWKWWKPFETSPLDTEFGGDTHPGLKGEAKIFVSPGYKFSWMKTALSIRVGAEAYLKATLDGGSNEKPFKAALAAGVDVQCEANIIDVDWPFLKKFGLKLKLIEPINYTVWGGEFVSIIGPIPEFDWQPIVPDAPAHITFYDRSTPTILNWFDRRLEYPVTDLEWNVGGAESKALQPRFLFEKEGTYPVQLRAKTRGMISGHNFKRHYVTVGKPEEIPDDPNGDEEKDDNKTDTGKQSCDPNEVNGPMGAGEARLVKPGDWMDYTIYFENKAGFDIADAQEVKVTNPLSEWLDWSTFEMREVAFNNQCDNSLDGLSVGTRDIKMNGTNKYVRVALGGGSDGEGSIAETGVAHWYLRVYDPNGQFGWPNDLSGFLPSNDDTHRGEGHLTYRIKVRDDAPANVVITNSASIVFDLNDPIETDPAWWNTVGASGAAFAESDVEANEGETATIKIMGGSADAAASVKVYLTYNTAAAADIDLTKGEIDGETPKGGLKFPLTLSWAKGEVGEKVITIPVKVDKTVEDDEFFTLQLAESVGMELGEERVCTVTIRDMNDKTLKTTVTPYKPKKNEMVATNSVTVAAGNAKGGFVSGTGEYTSGSKLTLTAEARPGWAFVGWATRSAQDILSSKTKWQIVVTNDEEYVAVFEKIPYVRGLADPADGGKVSGSALCPAGKKATLKATTNKNFTFVGWTTNAARSASAPYQDGDFVATTASLVIDRSAKPAANSKTSTTITEIDGDVTYYAVFKSDPEIFVTVDATDGTGAEPTGKGAGKYVAGTITGMGKYAPGKTKIALKAAANKGYVFAGWFDADSELLTKNATYTVASMGENDVEYTAKFITADEDKGSIALSVNGEEMAAAGAGRPPYRTNVWCGVYLEWPVASSALSATTVKVAGLPAGLKFTDKPVTAKVGTGKTAVLVTNVPANTIYGAPTSASKTAKDKKTGAVTATPSAVKFTVTTAGKSSQTYQIDTVVNALPTWAQGTFEGSVKCKVESEESEELCGTVSLAVSSAGKISGKALGEGLTYTLAAPYYSGFELTEGVSNFLADVTASWSYKVGTKTIKTNEVVQMSVQDNGIGGVAMGGARPVAPEGADAPSWTAWQYNWKAEPWKTLGKSFDKKTMTYAILSDGSFSDDEEDLTSALGADVPGRVTLKFAATGAVAVSGEFAMYDEKKGKYTAVKATGSATLVPVDEERVVVFVYLAPKGLPPHARCVDVAW